MTEREKRCERCELPEWLCSCDAVKRDADEVRRRRRALLQQPGVTTSNFDFTCVLCGERALTGTPIMRYADGWGHADAEQCSEITR